MEKYLILSTFSGVIALAFAYILSISIAKADPGNARMQEIAGYIHEGAMAFLYREYRYLSVFVVLVFVVLSLSINWQTAVCFLGGAICSVLAGYFGMQVATKANVRTAQAARGGIAPALRIAFSGGSVMGMSVAGLGMLGLGTFYLAFDQNVSYIAGFSLGASSIALFARVGGGIYTKAADVGADLVGKVEAGIPEDDPRNPAVIADNVGDNVGDVAGMGADLFESYVGAIVGAFTLAAVLFAHGEGVLYVFCLCGLVGAVVEEGVQFSLIFAPKAAMNPRAVAEVIALRSGDTVEGAIESLQRGKGIILSGLALDEAVRLRRKCADKDQTLEVVAQTEDLNFSTAKEADSLTIEGDSIRWKAGGAILETRCDEALLLSAGSVRVPPQTGHRRRTAMVYFREPKMSIQLWENTLRYSDSPALSGLERREAFTAVCMALSAACPQAVVTHGFDRLAEASAEVRPLSFRSQAEFDNYNVWHLLARFGQRI